MKKQNEINIEQEVVLNENIQAPISEGQKLGEVRFKLDGEIVGTTDLIAVEKVDKVTFFTMGRKICEKWFYLFRK